MVLVGSVSFSEEKPAMIWNWKYKEAYIGKAASVDSRHHYDHYELTIFNLTAYFCWSVVVGSDLIFFSAFLSQIYTSSRT